MKIWNGFYLFALFITLLGGILILSKKDKKKQDIFLFIYILSGSIILLAFYLYFEYSFDEGLLILIYRNQLEMPLLLFYVFSVIRPDRKFNKKWLLLYIPLGISILHIGWNLITLTEAEIDSFFSATLLTVPFFHLVTLIIDLLMEPVIVIILLRALYKYRLQLKSSYSNLKGIEYRWIRRLLWLDLTAWFIIGITSYFLNMFFPEYEHILFNIGGVFIAVIVIYLGYFGIRHTHLFTPQIIVYDSTEKENSQRDDKKDRDTEEGEKKEKELRYSKSTLTNDMAEDIKKALEQQIHQERLYLNPKLSLAEVADAVGYPAHSISEVLNKYMKITFYDLVNDMRVEEAKQRLADGSLENQTILAIALDSGFNSKSSFNRLFKLKTGTTPSQYAACKPG